MKKLLVAGLFAVALSACNSKSEPFYQTVGSVESAGLIGGTVFVQNDGIRLKPSNFALKIEEGLDRQYGFISYTLNPTNEEGQSSEVRSVTVSQFIPFQTEEVSEDGSVTFFNDAIYGLDETTPFICYNDFIYMPFAARTEQNKPVLTQLEGKGLDVTTDTMRFELKHNNAGKSNPIFTNHIAFDIADYIYDNGYNDKPRVIEIATRIVTQEGDTIVKKVSTLKPYDPNEPFATAGE